MDSWHSYPSIFAVGHRAVAEMFDDPVLIEEKIDGSQISWGVFDGELKVRSKGAILNLVAPEGMFVRAVESIRSFEHMLHPGWTYRGEYLQKPKHNALAYDRTPNNHIILFDINTANETYMPYDDKRGEAERIGLETVPRIFEGNVEDMLTFRSFLDTTSILGGQKIEGVVAKNYARFGPDKKVLMAKFVSEAFKEVHAKGWKDSNPGGKDIVALLKGQYATKTRWNKAIQHLRERGELEDSPRDIGKVIAEIGVDVEKECRDEIANALYQWAWPQIRRGLSAGFPEFYKELLLAKQFDA